MHSIVLGRDPLDQAAHAILGRVYLAEIPDLAATLTIGDSDGIARLGDVNANENLCRMIHGSPSCAEDRLGPPEQPSLEQSRASHLGPRNGRMVLRSNSAVRSDRRLCRLVKFVHMSRRRFRARPLERGRQVDRLLGRLSNSEAGADDDDVMGVRWIAQCWEPPV